MKVEVEFLDDKAEEEYTLIFEYIPQRDPPFCMDHDNPAFYDCGDPEEVEFIGEIDSRELPDYIDEEELCETLIDDIRQAFTDTVDDLESNRYDY